MKYKDRVEAGRLLAFHLKNNLGKINLSDVVIVGLAKGGLVVAVEVARELNAPFLTLVVKKIGHPDNSEFALGAITLNEVFLNSDPDIDMKFVTHEAMELKKEITKISKIYSKFLPKVNLNDKVVVIVDDGLATGFTMRAAVAEVKLQKPKKIYVALPVAAQESLAELSDMVDKIYCLLAPSFFNAVGEFYFNFPQLGDKEILDLLVKNRSQ